jgi:TatD-related deoxyribonuclease
LPLPADLPIVDHHCHLSPSGEGVKAAQRFRTAGGTHLFLTTQNYETGVPGSLEDYRRQYEVTARLADRIREETGTVVYVVVAPYPVDLVSLVPRLGPGEAVAVHSAALDLAATWVKEHRAVALGEVGRPHFAVSAEVQGAADEVLRHALEAARDAGCPAVVHSEDLTPDGYRDLAALAARSGLPTARVIKHYARVFVPPDERCGVTPSFLARRELAAGSIHSPGPWFWETDFLDDPVRPGAVLDLTTVPRRAAQFLAREPSGAELLRGPFQDSVQAVYGFRPEIEDVPAS